MFRSGWGIKKQKIGQSPAFKFVKNVKVLACSYSINQGHRPERKKNNK